MIKKPSALFIALLIGLTAHADVKITELPQGSASSSGATDPVPYVEISSSTTKKMQLGDLKNLPTMRAAYLSTDTQTQGASNKTLTTTTLAGTTTNTGTVTGGTFTGITLGGSTSLNTTGTVYVNNTSGTVAPEITADVTTGAVDSLYRLDNNGSGASARSWGIYNRNATGRLDFNVSSTKGGDPNAGSNAFSLGANSAIFFPAYGITPGVVTIGAGAGQMTVYSILPNTLGGTGTDSSASSGLAHVASGTWTFSQLVNADVSASAAIAYSKLLLTGSVVNADVSSSAAIAYAKLNLAGSIVNADIATGAAVAYAKLNLTGSIVNADINASAAIADSKLATISTAGKVASTALPAFTGDVTTSAGSTATTIAAGAVTLAKMANLAANSILGNNTGSGATPIALTASQVNTFLGSLSNPMTTGGDLIYGGTSGLATRLANGSAGNVLQSGGGTAAPSWRAITAPTVSQVTVASHTGGFSANTSGTYTTPAGVLYFHVKMNGGGGGGAGSSTVAAQDGGNGGSGGTSTFGAGLLSASGGGGGQAAGGSGGGGSGGSFSIGSAVGIGFPGGSGQGVAGGATSERVNGGQGGTNCFGGAGGGGGSATAGSAAAALTGSGGGGAGGPTAGFNGSGGGASGCIEDVLIFPTAGQTFSYTVGAAGAAGSAGTSGLAGGTGATAMITIYESYQ